MKKDVVALLSAPGKTFLVGEYVALAGGPSIVLATEPRFELRVYSDGCDPTTPH